MRRTTWILLLVFGLLVIFTWLFQRYQATKSDTSATATPFPTAEKVYSLTNMQVNEMIISDNKGNQVDLYRDDTTANNWAVRGEPVDKADKVGIQTAISQLISIQIIDRMADNPPLDSLGLAAPLYSITLKTTDGQQLTTNVGIENPIKTGYYIRVGLGLVVLVDNITLDDILNYLKKPPLLATPTPEVTGTQSGTPIAPDVLVTPTP